jgi:hypothetical protein
MKKRLLTKSEVNDLAPTFASQIGLNAETSKEFATVLTTSLAAKASSRRSAGNSVPEDLIKPRIVNRAKDERPE